MLKYFSHCLTLLLLTGILACDQTPQLRPLPSDAVVLAFGDSLTHGTGASKKESYPAHLETLISRKVINAGIPGEISATGLKRLSILLQRQQPDLLILCHGGNDILRHYNLKQTKTNIQKMIDLAKNNGTDVVLIGVPQFGVFLSSAKLYQELAEQNQLPIENTVLSEILGKNKFKSDQIHPNAQGYTLLAERIQTLLQNSGAL